MRFLIGIFLISLSLGQVAGLSEERVLLSQALLMERAGDISGARNIYSKILMSDPHNQRAFRQLKSILIRLGENEQTLELMREWLNSNPQDFHSRLDLGEALYNNNQVDEALKVWLKFEKDHLTNETAFRMIFHVYARFGLTENMVRIQTSGRLRFSKPDFLALEMGNYYQLRQSYDLALEAYLLAALNNPGMVNHVLDRILLMSDIESALGIIETSLLSHVDSSSVLIHEILAAFYFKTGSFSKALARHKILGLKTQADYRRFLNFAGNLLEEKVIDLALEAYHYLIDGINENNKSSSIIGEALLGLGQTYEYQIILDHNALEFVAYFPNNIFFEDVFFRKPQVSSPSLVTTLEHYQSILNGAAPSGSTAKVHFRLGEIQYRIIKDFSGARQSYLSALNSRPGPELKNLIILRLGDLYLAEGKLEESALYFQKLLLAENSKDPITRISLRYLQSRLLSLDIDKSADMLDSLLVEISPRHLYFNDLVELQELIVNHYQEGSLKDRLAFENYLRAEVFIRGNNLEQALEIFAVNKVNFSGASINPLGALREALLRLKAGDTEGALKISLSLSNTVLKDKGLALAGEISENFLNNRKAALIHYNRVLDECSTSPLTEPIRLHIRKLGAKES
ncbi:MAG: tetratricopeptide repeat protein [Candidatus Neomarinimicrobiota bacterium]